MFCRTGIYRWLLAIAMTPSFLLSIVAHAATEPAAPAPGIEWHKGPYTADLNGVATLNVPKGFVFADGNGARRFLDLNQSPSNGDEVGIVMPITQDRTKIWFTLFEFHEVGYITDSDKKSLDNDALLSSIKEDTEEGNKIRAKKGWAPFHVTSWTRTPFYDPITHNLTWAVLGESENKDEGLTVNYSTRILGRKGTMSVDLVLDPSQLDNTLPLFNDLLTGFQYQAGNRYSEFVKGDKVAGYGLAALIGGGAAALAVKTGLFAKLWKFVAWIFVALWKFILVIVAAIVAKIKQIARAIKKMFSKREPPVSAGNIALPPPSGPSDNAS